MKVQAPESAHGGEVERIFQDLNANAAVLHPEQSALAARTEVDVTDGHVAGFQDGHSQNRFVVLLRLFPSLLLLVRKLALVQVASVILALKWRG